MPEPSYLLARPALDGLPLHPQPLRRLLHPLEGRVRRPPLGRRLGPHRVPLRLRRGHVPPPADGLSLRRLNRSLANVRAARPRCTARKYGGVASSAVSARARIRLASSRAAFACSNRLGSFIRRRTLLARRRRASACASARSAAMAASSAAT